MLTRNKKLLILFAIILSFFIFRKELFPDKQNAVPLEDEPHHESPKKHKVSTHTLFTKGCQVLSSFSFLLYLLRLGNLFFS